MRHLRRIYLFPQTVFLPRFREEIMILEAVSLSTLTKYSSILVYIKGKEPLWHCQIWPENCRSCKETNHCHIRNFRNFSIQLALSVNTHFLQQCVRCLMSFLITSSCKLVLFCFVFLFCALACYLFLQGYVHSIFKCSL